MKGGLSVAKKNANVSNVVKQDNSLQFIKGDI